MTFHRRHPAHVPRQSRRRSRLVSRVSIPGSFRLVFAEVRKPMESFLISDESALSRPRTKVHAPFSSTDFISARFFRVARFFFPPYARSAMIHGRLFLTETALFETGK